MKKLKLYTAFHLNLAFSSIPQEQYALAIDRCYWPMIDILEKFENIKFGLEFTGYTLEKIKEVDYTFIEKLKELHSKGKCEFLGSGMSQAIFPLIPEKVNVKNIEIGNKLYEEILGVVPITGYVNEQSYSDGIAEIYSVNEYENLVMEYENSNLFNKYPKEFKYKSHKVKAGEGELNLVWNSSIAFQKLQRYAFGQITEDDYLEYLNSNFDENKDRALCLYGSDLEIFDYKPGNYDWFYSPKGSDEMDRLYHIFEFLNNSDRFEFVLPKDVAKQNNSNEFISISTAQYPLVCKKQPKYNVVRWAVSGLQNAKMNTQCNRVYKDLTFLSKFNKDDEVMWKNLCLLYGSDYRTKTTESKFTEYHSLLGKTEMLIEEQLDLVEKFNENEYAFCLINTNEHIIEDKFIYECVVKFKQGQIFKDECHLLINDIKVNFQFEDIEYYRDGSIRSCKVVMELPVIEPQEKIYGKFVKGINCAGNIQYRIKDNVIETEKVKIEFSTSKKGTIEKLILNDISDNSILGSIKHGYYDDITYSVDYFSGHTILREKSLNQITDLDKSNIIYPDKDDKFNIRVPIKSKVNGEFGDIWKIYYIYINQSRIDIEYNFRFKDICPIFFRTGILTFNPECFNIDTLRYKTHNGGKMEEYQLNSKEFNQTDMISLNISANSCMGATDEKFIIGDDKKEVVIQRDNSLLYTVPMLEYREIDDKYIMRLYHSLSETDDTGSVFWRGHSKFKMSITNTQSNLFNNGIFFSKNTENN
ncbi:alpha-amylase [Clostridium botulinum]|uniref:alpha-amylase n=1 Tax=Clostridium sp. ZBS18 TaxID=2949967 RepID=UPI001D623941|nr:alpha-amylase [Clostridium sp. ZBS18]MBN1054455.1 alpha-amylase [Clostridium botulinum]